MDSINVVNLKFEKANAMKRFDRLRKITILFRVIEFLFIVIVISRFSVQIPVKISVSGEYLRRLYSAVFSPRFVFIIGNAIVVILFLKNSDTPNSKANEAYSNTYSEIVEKTEKRVREKRESEKKFCRSKSEDLRKVVDREEVPRKQLRRSVTETRRRISPAAAAAEEEEMSGEEFRRKVEAFIERQQRSLREQEFSAIVTYK